MTRGYTRCRIEAKGAADKIGTQEVFTLQNKVFIQKMDGNPIPTGGSPWAIALLLLLLFMWLIPLFHASRSGRVLPVIEVMLLLGASILIMVVSMLGAGVGGLVGMAMIIPMAGAASILWFAALLIALFAELGAAQRNAPQPRTIPSRYPQPRRIEEPEFR